MLKDFTDIHSSHLTHWSQAQLTASRLGRIYVSIPGWLLLYIHTTACAMGDPLLRSLHGSSDHVPESVTLAHKWKGNRRALSMPLWV